jgi:hypothetical protein
LRHDRLVRRHDEQDGVDAARAREHVAYETLVTRHVDERDPDSLPLRVRESEIYRDPATLLFRKTIGVDAGQRADERGLPMVDVPRRPDHESPHTERLTQAR